MIFVLKEQMCMSGMNNDISPPFSDFCDEFADKTILLGVWKFFVK